MKTKNMFMLIIMMAFIGSNAMYAGTKPNNKPGQPTPPPTEMQHHGNPGHSAYGHVQGEHRGPAPKPRMFPVKGCHCKHCKALRKQMEHQMKHDNHKQGHPHHHW